ncbi:DtxR family Mn-dependent transcriptional regulator [Maribacter caenipelagi]|uniref:DtxR family Mn-dependent transcriptional regulator n=1 Tax=Maribacter caenipelagi TaxID=1447781 RepID=A0A4R7D7A3_9FLAO|nr:DtxR family transcriptional regulator [Maribacter caenipelagi]TDS16850.1 DtxR family Mn-dependent transcriptional regulator [Maribacter caenipelagi]
MELILNPITSLIIGTVFLILLSWILWPRKGLISLWSKRSKNTKQKLQEDALKFIFDCEYKHKSCGLHTISGNMNISTNKAAKVLGQLQSIGLIVMKEDQIRLTDAGRSDALKIIRIHRIWERYLADETAIDNLEWHQGADSQEHLMSLKEVDVLAATMGNPVFDPHGDPIPTTNGELPTYQGQSLSSLKEGDIARITHIEDEPSTIYAQLVALDLHPGMEVYIMDVTDENIQFAANGKECILNILFASNITVEKLSKIEPTQKKYQTLSSLNVGDKAQVIGISPKCRGQERIRLMDLGIVPGTEISAVLKSAFGDPTAYKIMGATIAIRKKQADNIYIKSMLNKNEQTASMRELSGVS